MRLQVSTHYLTKSRFATNVVLNLGVQIVDHILAASDMRHRTKHAEACGGPHLEIGLGLRTLQLECGGQQIILNAEQLGVQVDRLSEFKAVQL